MFKSRFQIAGEALAIAALSASAAAQNPQAPINTLTDRKLWLHSARVPWRSGGIYGFQSLAHKQIWVVDVLTRITRQTRSKPKQFRALAEELDERQDAKC
jgi:hypothetical protein